MTCKVKGCDGLAYRARYCRKHYRRLQRHGDVHYVGKRGPKGGRSLCTVDGCTRAIQGHGLCPMHYMRWRVHGDPLMVAKRGPKPRQSATA